MTSRSSKVGERKIADRDAQFPNAEQLVYDHTKYSGFTSMPKAMPLILRVMDHLSVGKPVSAVYLDLFCYVFKTKEGYLSGLQPTSRAFYAGLCGQRGPYVWKERMRTLRELGFIQVKPGETGEFHHVLIVNPLLVMRDLVRRRPPQVPAVLLDAYVSRQRELGMDDAKLDPPAPASPKGKPAAPAPAAAPTPAAAPAPAKRRVKPQRKSS